MDYHVIAGGVSVSTGFVIGLLYIREVLRGDTKPHVFTWLVWALLMSIAAAVSFAGGAIIGALVLAAGAALNFIITGLALRYGERNITRSDWAMFLSALAIIPIWVMTKEPLTAAVLVTSIDLLGCVPTFRKGWLRPHEESAKVFALFAVTNVFTVLSVTPYNFVTGLYPTMCFAMDLLLATMLLARRRAVAASA
ncbi:MAG TPA: hypothetical protein DCY07_04370 [Rhodospirillaceae bacterium]|nr:hypothetical protein [Rhodospirillaceae bacterium]